MTDDTRHFLDLQEIDPPELRKILDKAVELKQKRHSKGQAELLAGKKLAMIFEKRSTRTRVSFEAGMLELGGHPLTFGFNDLQLGRGEPVADTARVFSRYVDAMMIRCHSHHLLVEMAKHGTIPIINGLSNRSHPCQVMADILTFEEKLGSVKGKVIAWLGDGNNVANSFISAAAQFGFSLRLACPDVLPPSADLIDRARSNGADILLTTKPEQVVDGAHAVVTDTWVSMGDDNEAQRVELLKPYQVNQELMSKADKDAIFLHCLPAYRGKEVTEDVIDGPQSVVWDEAENRLHVQKAILLWCLRVI